MGRSVCREVRAELELARWCDLPFEVAWAQALDTALEGVTDWAIWDEVFEATREAWRSAYERTPVASRHHALAALEEVA